MVQFGFLGCPATKQNATQECADLKKLVETQDKCGRQVEGKFIVEADFFYEAAYYKTSNDVSENDVSDANPVAEK